MAGRGLAYALAALTGGFTGYQQGKQWKADQEEKAANNLLKRRQLDQADKEIKYKEERWSAERPGIEADTTRKVADSYFSGFQAGPDGKPGVNPDFLNQESPLFKALSQKAAFDRMSKSSNPESSVTWGDYANFTGKALPQGIDPKRPIPNNVAGDLFKPRAEATPEQVNEHRKVVGDPTGLTPAQIMNNIAQAKQQSRLADQFAITDRRSKEQHDTNKGLQIASGVKDEVKGIQNIDESINRLQSILDQAPNFKPSGAEYYALQSKAKASSYDPGRLFGGDPLIFKGLSPKDTERMKWYQGLSTDAIYSMFERGGKQLTPTEKEELGNLAITQYDTAEQIAAKSTELMRRLRKDRDASQSVIDMFQGAGQRVKSSPIKGGVPEKRKPSGQKNSSNQDQQATDWYKKQLALPLRMRDKAFGAVESKLKTKGLIP